MRPHKKDKWFGHRDSFDADAARNCIVCPVILMKIKKKSLCQNRFFYFLQTRLAEQHEGHRDVRLEFSRGGPNNFFFFNQKFWKSCGTRLGVKKKKKFFSLTKGKYIYRRVMISSTGKCLQTNGIINPGETSRRQLPAWEERNHWREAQDNLSTFHTHTKSWQPKMSWLNRESSSKFTPAVHAQRPNRQSAHPSRCGFPFSLLLYLLFIIPETVLAGNSKKESTTVKVDSVRDDDKEKVYFWILFFLPFHASAFSGSPFKKWENRKIPQHRLFTCLILYFFSPPSFLSSYFYLLLP